MKSKKETFQISLSYVNNEGRRRLKWAKVQGERVDDDTAIRREAGKGWIIWDIKTGNIICTKRARSIADAVAYYEEKYKAIVKDYRKTTSYAKVLTDSTDLFNDPQRELKKENENTAAEETGSNKKEEKQEEAAKTETVEVPQVKALPAPKKEEEASTVNKASDTVTASPATDRQARYLAALAKKLHNRQIIDVKINYSRLDKETASRLIDESLKAIERGRRGNKKVPASYLLNSFRAAA